MEEEWTNMYSIAYSGPETKSCKKTYLEKLKPKNCQFYSVTNSGDGEKNFH